MQDSPAKLARWPEHGAVALVAFSTATDGVFSSWWGIDEDGRVLQLVTDFGVGSFRRPVLPDDPAFRALHVEQQLAKLRTAVAAMAASGGVRERAAAYEAAAEITAAGIEAQPILAELLVELRARQRDVIAADPLILVARRLAEHPAMQPPIAAWLAQAPAAAAATFLLTHRIAQPNAALARAMAATLRTVRRHRVQHIVELSQVETERDAFRPWLEQQAASRDREIAEAARGVLERWSRRP